MRCSKDQAYAATGRWGRYPASSSLVCIRARHASAPSVFYLDITHGYTWTVVRLASSKSKLYVSLIDFIVLSVVPKVFDQQECWTVGKVK